MSRRRTRNWIKRNIATALFFCASLTLTLLTWQQAHKNVQLQTSFRFQDLSQQVQESVIYRMQVYANMLEQTRGIFALNESVTPAEFRDYVANMRAKEEYPGIQGIGFVRRISADTLPTEIQQHRQDPGFEEFRVWPEGPREVYHPIMMLEPMDGRNERAIGYDMYTEEIRREAMLRAMHSGRPALTGIVTLTQETESNPQPGLLLYVPVYHPGLPLSTEQEREAALLGFVYAPFRARDLFAGTFDNLKGLAPKDQFDFEIFMGPGPTNLQTLLFDRDEQYRSESSATVARDDTLHAKTNIEIAGKQFQINVFGLPPFVQARDSLVPFTVLIFGLLLTALLTRILWVNGRQAEHLVKSERQLRLVTDALPVLICYIDTNAKFLFNNQAFESWFGASRAQLAGRPAVEALSASESLPLSEALNTALAGQPAQLECELTLHSGTRRACLVQFIPDLGPNSLIKGAVGLITDISERQRWDLQTSLLIEATTALLQTSLESEAALARFCDTLLPRLADWITIDLIAEDDRPTTRAWAAHRNPALTTILQNMKLRHETISTTLEPRLYNSSSARDLMEEPQQIEQRGQVASIGWASTIVVPLAIRGRNIGVLTIGRASTSYPYDEADLRFVSDLAQRAALAIENARLFREAHKANRSKDEFLATLSHELRTPMNVILGWIEILQNEKPDAETVSQALLTLERNARVQIELINDLLDISRIISGKMNLTVRSMNISEVIDFAVESVRPAAQAKNISIRTEKPAHVPSLHGDPDRLQQVLWNLLTNAIKFTSPGGHIDVVLHTEAGGVRIDVADTGQGIEPHFLPFVFDRFRQEDGSTTRNHGGLGIGLAIVRYIVELHGGHVEVASLGKGHGATFTVRLPESVASSEIASTESALGATSVKTPSTDEKPIEAILTAQQLPAATVAAATVAAPTRTASEAQLAMPSPVETSTPPEAVTAAPLPSLHDLDILLVDDSPDVRLLLTRILNKAGANVRAVASATEALQLLRRGSADVLVSDIGLPEVDGYSLIRKIREMEQSKNRSRLPAAALTAYAQASDAEQALAAGYDRHLPKPVSGEDLVRTVAELARLGPNGPNVGVPMLHGL